MKNITQNLQFFWSELCRRRTIRTIIAYLIILAAVIGPASDILGGLGAPEWVLQLLIYLFIAFFPFVIVVSWIFDVSPEGIRRTDSVYQEPYEHSENSMLKNSEKEFVVDLNDIAANGALISTKDTKIANSGQVRLTISLTNNDELSSDTNVEENSDMYIEDPLLAEWTVENDIKENNCVSLDAARKAKIRA